MSTKAKIGDLCLFTMLGANEYFICLSRFDVNNDIWVYWIKQSGKI